jgi:hypothetical protein
MGQIVPPTGSIFCTYWSSGVWRVPLALIMTIIIQSAGLVWWASSVSERVNSLERTREATAPQADRLTRVEVKLEGVQSGIDEIKRLIRREP